MNNRTGFSLIELIVVVGIIAVLSSFAFINLFNTKYTASFQTSIDTLITDFKQQQLKAMVGDTEGRGGSPDSYGIHFETNTYTLFHGTIFNQSDTSNFTIKLGDNIQILDDWNLQSIIFTALNGEVLIFNSSKNNFKIKNVLTQDQKTVTFNKFGIITSVN